MKKVLIRHGAIIIFNAVQLIILFMVITGQAWHVLPAFSFIILIDSLYVFAIWHNK